MNYGYSPSNNFNMPIGCGMCSGNGFIIDTYGVQQPCQCRMKMNCNMCQGSGYFINTNGLQQPCQCSVSPGTVIHGHKHHRNIFQYVGDKFRAIFGCSRCHGNGWVYSKYGNQTYCPSCITANRYCPKCNNNGFKIKNGRPCNHYF